MKTLFYISLLVGILANSVQSRIVYVPQDAPTIQAGLDSLLDNDTVFVSCGTYVESLNAPPLRFTMIGETSADTCNNMPPTIDATSIGGGQTTAALNLPPFAKARITNLQIINQDRYGIRSEADSVDLRNCRIVSTFYGFRELQDSIGSAVIMQYCQFVRNQRACVDVRPGNKFLASHCEFDGDGYGTSGLVGADNMTLDSCEFTSNVGRMLLIGTRGPFKVTNCSFGPVTMQAITDVVYLSGDKVLVSGNTFIDCRYDSHVLTVQSNQGDSVTISDNVFENCVQVPGQFSAQGVLKIDTPTPGLEHGAIIRRNTFTNCSGQTAVDDIYPSTFSPAVLDSNLFISDAHNGLPSIYAGNPIWQQTPLTMRNNVWDSCGYAADLSASADARFNYWGHNSGPFHAESNPTGLGDTITGPMQFIPWLTDSADNIEQQETVMPGDYQLTLFPNPFNSSVTIEYALTREQDVILEIFDVLGRQVEMLLHERQGMGVHSVTWKAEALASGLYFARLSSPDAALTAKLMLLK